MTQPSDKRPGAFSSGLRLFWPYVLGGLVIWAACVALAYLSLAQDVGLAVIFGSLFPFVGYYIWKTIQWWRGGLLPDDADQRRWSTSPTWSDFSRPAVDDDDDVRRAVCAETIFGCLLVLGPFALFALDGRVDEVVLVSAIGGAFAVSALLWITVVAWGRPRWLLPAEYRQPERYAAARRTVTAKKQMQPKRKQTR